MTFDLQIPTLASLERGGRLAVLGIGNELNGDDAAGPLVARGMAQKLADRESQGGSRSAHIYIADVGPSPESFTGPLRRFAPDLVVLVDAAELGEPPGTVRSFDWSAAEGLSASTHTLPPSMLARFLINELGCRVMLVGIQPKSLEFDTPVSEDVRRAVERVVEAFFQG